MLRLDPNSQPPEFKELHFDTIESPQQADTTPSIFNQLDPVNSQIDSEEITVEWNMSSIKHERRCSSFEFNEHKVEKSRARKWTQDMTPPAKPQLIPKPKTGICFPTVGVVKMIKLRRTRWRNSKKRIKKRLSMMFSCSDGDGIRQVTEVDMPVEEPRRTVLKDGERGKRQMRKMRGFWNGSSRTMFPIFRIGVVSEDAVVEMEDLSFKNYSMRKDRVKELDNSGTVGDTFGGMETELSGKIDNNFEAYLL